MLRKKELRQQMINMRNKLIPADVKSAGIVIGQKIIKSNDYIHSDIIIIYVSAKNEVDTYMIIKQALDDNKKVAVPKVIDKGIMNFYYISNLDELKQGYMGIMEPDINNKLFDIKTEDNIIMICPGVAFDKKLNRLGYGGGYYDRYLSNENIKKIALAYEFQVIEKVPVEQHDVKVDKIITEKSIYW